MISTEAEFQEHLDKLQRLYQAMRIEFSKITLDEQGAAKLLRTAKTICDHITICLSEIEEYSGAAEVRRLQQAMREIHDRRNQALKD